MASVGSQVGETRRDGKLTIKLVHHHSSDKIILFYLDSITQLTGGLQDYLYGVAYREGCYFIGRTVLLSNPGKHTNTDRTKFFHTISLFESFLI